MLDTQSLLGFARVLYAFLSYLSTFTLFLILSWTIYHTPIVLAAILSRKREDEPPRKEDAPKISVIVPVKDDARVAERALHSILLQDYPRDKIEVIIVDGSREEVSGKVRSILGGLPMSVKYVREEKPNGKPSALNRALPYATGQVIAVLDADNMLDREAFKNAVKYFADPRVKAVQGVIDSLNEKDSAWTKVASKEEMLWNRVLLRGRSKLGLFTPLSGSCFFVSSEALRKVGGFPNTLAEDLDLSLKLVKQGYWIVYAEDVRGMWETPRTLRALVVQRRRWYRGYMESLLRNWRIVRPSRKLVDAEIVMAGPILLVLSFLTIIWWLAINVLGFPRLDGGVSAYIVTSLNFFSIFTVGAALSFGEKPRRLANIAWIPLVYAYWLVMMAVAFYAFLLVLFRRPARWERTPKY
jgi:cellulose synthase/poly-beta-1,6-N-acetylglucosamine synthase-like glycosyltransferase